MKTILTCLLSVFAFSALAHYSHRVRKVTAIDHSMYKNEHGKIRTQVVPDYFIVYDTTGREIEYGYYGEYTCQTFSNGSVITTGCSRDNSKISNVEFYTYDWSGKKIRSDVWYYKNNEKEKLENFTIYDYDSNNALCKETKYNSPGLEMKRAAHRAALFISIG